jgi:hypothetical protein
MGATSLRLSPATCGRESVILVSLHPSNGVARILIAGGHSLITRRRLIIVCVRVL